MTLLVNLQAKSGSNICMFLPYSEILVNAIAIWLAMYICISVQRHLYILDISCSSWDTIRDAVLTCAQKLTWVSLVYSMEPTTKKVENRKVRSKKQICSEMSINSWGNPRSQSWRKERLWWEGFAGKEGFKSGMKQWLTKTFRITKRKCLPGLSIFLSSSSIVFTVLLCILDSTEPWDSGDPFLWISFLLLWNNCSLVSFKFFLKMPSLALIWAFWEMTLRVGNSMNVTPKCLIAQKQLQH